MKSQISATSVAHQEPARAAGMDDVILEGPAALDSKSSRSHAQFMAIPQLSSVCVQHRIDSHEIQTSLAAG